MLRRYSVRALCNIPGLVYHHETAKKLKGEKPVRRINYIKFVVPVICFLIAACGGPRSTIDIKSEGTAIPFIEKGSGATVQKALFSGSDAPNQEHALRWITIRNFDSDGAKRDPHGDKLTAPEQVKIFLSLHDEAGSKVDTPLKPASYKGAKSTGPMSFELINVYVFRDGKEQRLYLYPSQQTDPATCEVKIISVEGDTVKGEINVSGKQDGKELIVKGPFTAQIKR